MSKREVILSQIKNAKVEQDQYAKQIEFLGLFIAKLESELNGHEPEPHGEVAAKRRSRPRRKLWDFSNKSKPEAVKLILNRYRRPMKTGELLDILLKAGMKIGGNSRKVQNANVFTVLKQTRLVEKLGGGYWALPEWDKERKRIPE